MKNQLPDFDEVVGVSEVSQGVLRSTRVKSVDEVNCVAGTVDVAPVKSPVKQTSIVVFGVGENSGCPTGSVWPTKLKKFNLA